MTGASSVADPRSAHAAASRSSSRRSFVLVSIQVGPGRGRRGGRRRRSTTSATAAGDGQAGDHDVGAARAASAGDDAPTRPPASSERAARPGRGRARSAGSRRAAGSPRGARRGDRRRRSRPAHRDRAPRPASDAASSPSYGMARGDLLVQLDTETRPGGRDHVAVLPADRRLRSSAWKPPQSRIPSRTRKFGLHAASWMFAAPTIGPQ